MIKIIKKGTRKQIECSQCGALLSYESEDVKLVNKANGWSDKEYITCPQCSNEIILMLTR